MSSLAATRTVPSSRASAPRSLRSASSAACSMASAALAAVSPSALAVQPPLHLVDAPVNRRMLEFECARRAGEAPRAPHREHRPQRFPVQVGCASMQIRFARIANVFAHTHILSCAHRQPQGAKDMKRFEGRTALVTGGTSGIGLATAKRLQDEGAKVIVTGTRDKTLEHARKALGDGAVAIRNDAGKPEAAAELAREVAKIAPEIDAVFFNAGFGRFQPLQAVDWDALRRQYAVHVRGPLLQAKALAPLLNDGAALLLNTSVVRVQGFPNMAVYASTKGAVRTLTRVLARELAPRKIRVNAVSPGPIETTSFARPGLSEP